MAYQWTKTDAAAPERVLLIGLDCGDYDAEASMAELERLTDTAGGLVVGHTVQKRPAPEGATYIGSGLVESLAEFCRQNEVDLTVADGSLTPVQARNLERALGTAVIDRTALILDIFAARARSSEGKLQVELAQLQYRLPRLGGQGNSLSRLGGGIGTRGPGESKLESDRRHIRRRITALQRELKTVQERRERMHLRRQKNRALTVALVGYTNAGKSTLMNALTDAGVLVDTVGLVQRLPHELVDAFRSTLAEAAWADVILDVCDASDPACNSQMQVTAQVLDSLGCGGKPLLHVLNKCDRVPGEERFPLLGTSVRISARTGEGLPQLLAEIDRLLPGQWARAALCIPFDRGDLTDRLHREGKVLAEDYTPAGTRLQVLADPALLEELRPYFI